MKHPEEDMSNTTHKNIEEFGYIKKEKREKERNTQLLIKTREGIFFIFVNDKNSVKIEGKDMHL